MEPGHEDREYPHSRLIIQSQQKASMEPGHEDREYHLPRHRRIRPDEASMEPGHEDREYTRASPSPSSTRRLNGARS